MNWVRVTKRNKCPICDHDTWCAVCPDVGIVLCMRDSSGRAKLLKSGETGYIHDLNGDHKKQFVARPKKEAPNIDWVEYIRKCWVNDRTKTLDDLWIRIGVEPWWLQELGAFWDPFENGWGFPMKDGFGTLTGIRIRSDSGAKWAVRGSHQGLFTPSDIKSTEILICEGPTDTAAALSMRYIAVGRPSCSGGITEIKTLVGRMGIKRVVIISDNDPPGPDGRRPGYEGAVGLQAHLTVPSCVAMLPCKDLREFIRLGGTKALLDSIIRNCVWTK